MSNGNVTYPPDVRAKVEEHCFSRLDVEVGGFLIGTTDESGTKIAHAHPALTATSAQTHLTFTHEAWDEVLPLMETEYEGLAIVGWYHSHPGFGVFLSDYDIFIQENFFSSPGQVALVVDPIAGKDGFLTASDGEWMQIQGGQTDKAAQGEPDAAKADVVAGVTSPKRRKAPLVVAGVLLGAVSLASGWFVGSVQGQDQGRASAQPRIDDLNAQVASLQQELDAANANPQPTPSPEPTPGPNPGPNPVPNPGPTPGDVVTIDVSHVLRPGETMWSLAATYLGSGEQYPVIEAANPNLDPGNLQPGTTIIVPVTGPLAAGN